ncbi:MULTISPECIES: glycosyltransferase [unclassified Thioalkalivibrio]|uniref:glycosyltransferase n=1 Tax=unclassified Thioalkalivibrio TaxID=2621013 RepID=UPI0003812820|nr:MULTISPECIES: glycosyltransferase [unclassified Thioalkalivibrio]
MRRAPTLSVIIPAWNEAEWLPRTLAAVQDALSAVDRPSEIIVVDNASTDATPQIAQRAGCRVVFEPERRISRARNAGAEAATGDDLLFVDADTWPDRDLLQATLKALDSGRVCGGGARVDFDHLNHHIYRWGAGAWNALAARLKLAAGCYVFCTREAFTAVGGFSEAVYAGEEVFLSRALRRWGRAHGQRVEILDTPVLTSGRKADWFHPGRHILVVLQVLLLPWSLRSRRLSWFWYTRPGSRD